MDQLRFAALVVFCLLAGPSAFAQPWVHEYTNLSDIDVSTVIYENENTSGSTIYVGVEVSAQTRRWVYGSVAAPPWTSKFTPLTNTFHTASYGVRNVPIPNGYEHIVWHEYNRETGEEQWSREFEEYVEIATRNRLWDTPVPGAIIAVTRMIQ